jgi:hypothetical protein
VNACIVTRLEAVSDAKDSLDPPVRIAAKLLSQAAHVYIEGASFHFGTVAPDFPQECVAGYNLAYVLDQMDKKLILFAGQLHCISVERNGFADEIQHEMLVSINSFIGIDDGIRSQVAILSNGTPKVVVKV